MSVRSTQTEALLAPERRAEIVRIVRRDKSALVKDLCAQFGVTSETIRKDLALLESEGQLIKTYGGAYIQEGVKNEIDSSIRKMILPEIKDAIALACAAEVEDGDTVFLDESTTCLAVARRLVGRNVTVVTNSLDIDQVLSAGSGTKVLSAGGELDRKNRCFVGGATEDFLSRYYTDKSFVSCRGADQRSGITDGNDVNGRIRALMLEQSRSSYLVLDHTKLGKANFFRVCGFEGIDVLVCDAFPDASWEPYLAKRGVRVLMAGSKGGDAT